jgi:hypothetical protein
MDEPRLITTTRNAARLAVLAGGIASVAWMLYAGRRQQSQILILLFAMWVLSPFMAGFIAISFAERWAVRTRAVLYTLLVVMTLGSLAIYGAVALEYVKAKIGFVFLVVPLASWLAIVVGIGMAMLSSRHSPRRRAPRAT